MSPPERWSLSSAPTGPTAEGILSVGDLLVALPGQRFCEMGVECYVSRDIGQVSNVKPEFFNISWERTGQTSRHPHGHWSKYFRRILEVEDRVAALDDDVGGHAAGIRKGDMGTVTHKDEDAYHITWQQNAQTTVVPKAKWDNLLERIKGLQVGDLVMVLPGQSCEKNGIDTFKEGDVGTVTKADEARYEIEWKRTGVTSMIKADKWQKAMKRFGPLKARLQVFDVIDRDQSGAITLKEWQDAFAKIDTNKDGHVTRKEWQMLEKTTALFDLLPRKYRSQISQKEWEDAFYSLDVDASGKISIDEWSPEAFASAWVSPVADAVDKRSSAPVNNPWLRYGNSEAVAAVFCAKGKSVFDDLDGDGQGVITLEEWRTAFAAIDKDGNGVLSRKEWQLRHGETYVFDAIPKRYTNQISRREWEIAFRILDTDRDDTITLEEWRTGQFSNQAKPATKVGRRQKRLRQVPTCKHKAETWERIEDADYLDYENDVDVDAMNCGTEAEMNAVKQRILKEGLSGFTIIRNMACLKRSVEPISKQDLMPRPDGVKCSFILPCPGCVIKAKDCNHQAGKWERIEGVDSADLKDVSSVRCATDEELKAAKNQARTMCYPGFVVRDGVAYFKHAGRLIKKEGLAARADGASCEFYLMSECCLIRAEAARWRVPTEVVRNCHEAAELEVELKTRLADYCIDAEDRRRQTKRLEQALLTVSACDRLRCAVDRLHTAAAAAHRSSVQSISRRSSMKSARPEVPAHLEDEVHELRSELLWIVLGEDDAPAVPYWEPYIGRVQRPFWLPEKGPGNAYVPPEKWGLTLRQWAAFIAACFMGDGPDYMTFDRSSGEGRDADLVTFYHIVDAFVKPWTDGIGSSVSLLLNNHRPLKAELLISHAWGESVVETMSAVLSRAFSMGLTLDAVVWFSAFSMYQPGDEPGDCGPTIAEQQALGPLSAVLAANPPDGLIAVQTSRGEFFSRLWCLHELSEASAAERAVTTAPSLKHTVEQQLRFSRSGASAPSRVDASRSACRFPDDERRLKSEATARRGSIEALSEFATAFRAASFDESLCVAKMLVQWCEHAEQILKEKDLVDGMIEKVRCAAIYLSLHCLVAECEAAGGIEQAQRLLVLDKARRTIEPMQLPGKRATHASPAQRTPPFFDASRRCDDLAFLHRLTDEKDDLLWECISGLERFLMPVGYLEMGAGGRMKSKNKDIDDIRGRIGARPGGFRPSLFHVPEDLSLQFTVPFGGPRRCFVELCSAASLRGADALGTSDPYCMCGVLGKPQTRCKTHYKKRTLAPQWFEAFEIKDYTAGDTLEFLVMDHDTVSKDDFLGWAKLSNDELQAGFWEGDLDLADDGKHGSVGQRSQGWISVRVFLTGGDLPDDVTKERAPERDPGTPAALRCFAEVVRAEGLRSSDVVGRSDPYCILGVVGKSSTRQQTAYKSRTLTPAWNQAFCLAGYVLGESIELIVMDHDVVTSDDFMGRAVVAGDQLKNKFFEGWLDLQDDGNHGATGQRSKGRMFVRIFLTGG